MKPKSIARSFRLSQECSDQIDALATQWDISATKVVELGVQKFHGETFNGSHVGQFVQFARTDEPLEDILARATAQVVGEDPEPLPVEVQESRKKPKVPKVVERAVEKTSPADLMRAAGFTTEKPKGMPNAQWEMQQRKAGVIKTPERAFRPPLPKPGERK